jgi:hypothetical protein
MDNLTDNEREILDDIVEMGFVPMELDRTDGMLAFINPNMLKGKAMKTVWKYEIPIQDDFQLQLPGGYKILTMAMQNKCPHIWVLVDPRQPLEVVKFRLAGTGHPIEQENILYIATAHCIDYGLVFHLFQMEDYADILLWGGMV